MNINPKCSNKTNYYETTVSNSLKNYHKIVVNFFFTFTSNFIAQKPGTVSNEHGEHSHQNLKCVDERSKVFGIKICYQATADRPPRETSANWFKKSSNLWLFLFFGIYLWKNCEI